MKSGGVQVTLILYTVGPDEALLESKHWGEGCVPLQDTEAAAEGRDESLQCVWTRPGIACAA